MSLHQLVPNLCWLVLVACIAAGGCGPRAPNWEEPTRQLTYQLERLHEALDPGGTASVEVAAPGADRLYLVPSYASEQELRTAFPELNPGMARQLSSLANSDADSGVLVWTKEGKVLSIQRFSIKGGFDLQPKSWPVDQRVKVAVRKEAESENTFLSLYFPEEP